MPDGLEDRLNAATARLIGRAVVPGDRFAIAVSGGADSMALLAAASACWPGQVEAASVDHRLRPEARAEAEMVASWCAGVGIRHRILTVSTALKGNIQSAAREARYELLERWRTECGLTWLMTGHQGDDQVETMLLRLGRGSGVGGLASVRPRRGFLLRPLLGEHRATLRRYCERAEVPFIDDPSNDDERFDRVRLRRSIAGRDLINLAGLGRSVEALADADAAIEWMTDALASDFLDFHEGTARLRRTDIPAEIQRRLLLRMIAHLNPEAEKPRGPSLDQALVQLFDAKSVALADCVVTGGQTWTAKRAPPRKSR